MEKLRLKKWEHLTEIEQKSYYEFVEKVYTKLTYTDEEIAEAKKIKDTDLFWVEDGLVYLF